LLCYADGERRYIIAPRGVEVGATLMSGSEAPIKPGNCLPLRNIPVGSTIHCIEMMPNKGAQIARSAGASVQLLARRAAMPSCACVPVKSARSTSTAAPPWVKSATKSTACVPYGKAGAKRWRGIRPTVRGTAMNPVDHPHGGGEGRTGEGRVPVSPWGQPTKGYRTRNNKRTDSMIVRRRHKA
jgi:large subunit ribosomal protein L2